MARLNRKKLAELLAADASLWEAEAEVSRMEEFQTQAVATLAAAVLRARAARKALSDPPQAEGKGKEA